MSTTNEVRLTQLDLLREAKGLLPDEEIADRARQILDGGEVVRQYVAGQGVIPARIAREIAKGMIGNFSIDETQLDIPSTRVGLADYLIEKGHSGPGVARLIVDFERAVVQAYVEEYHEQPSRDESRVFIFDTADRPLIDRVYNAKINAIAEASGVELR